MDWGAIDRDLAGFGKTDDELAAVVARVLREVPTGEARDRALEALGVPSATRARRPSTVPPPATAEDEAPKAITIDMEFEDDGDEVATPPPPRRASGRPSAADQAVGALLGDTAEVGPLADLQTFSDSVVEDAPTREAPRPSERPRTVEMEPDFAAGAFDDFDGPTGEEPAGDATAEVGLPESDVVEDFEIVVEEEFELLDEEALEVDGDKK